MNKSDASPIQTSVETPPLFLEREYRQEDSSFITCP